MRRLISTLAISVLIAFFASYGLATDRRWTAVPEGDLKDLPQIMDIATIGNDVFAVGVMGLFYHYDSDSGSLTRIQSPTTATLRHVWARNAKEVYALGDGGTTILYFDGSTLKRLGPQLPVVNRKDHPELDARPCEVEVQSIWANSPRDVWVTGLPMILLHFDGERWTDVDIGARQVIVPSDTRLTRAVVSPRIGPVWGTGPGDVWVRKEVVEAVEKPRIGPLRPRRAYFRSTHVLMRFDGSKWHETDKKMPVASSESQAVGLRIPEVQVIAPTVIWARFDNALHRWDNSSWKIVAELPKSKKIWTYWTGSRRDAALIFNLGDGLRELEKGAWATVSPVPDDLVGNGPLGLTDDGTIVVRGPHYKRLVLGQRHAPIERRESGAEPAGPEVVTPAAVDRFGDALPEGVVRRFGSLRFRHAGGYKSISELAFSPDGKRIASARDGSIRLLDVSTGKVLADFQTHAAGWTSIVFSPDSKRLLSGGEAAVLELRDIASFRPVPRADDRVLRGQNSNIIDRASSADGPDLPTSLGHKTR